MNPRRTLLTFLLAFGAAIAALVAAFAADLASGGSSPVLTSIVGAAVLAGLFAVRPMPGLLAFGIAVLLVDTVSFWAGREIRYLDEAAIPMIVVLAVALHRDRIRPPRFGLREGGLTLLVGAALLSTLLEVVPLRVWAPGLVLLLKGVAFFYLVASLRFEEDEIRHAMLAAFGFGLGIAATGLAEFVAPEAVRAAYGLAPIELQRGQLTIVTGVFLHPALYGWLTAFLSLFLYARFAVDRAPWALPFAVILNLGTLLSGRRTPLVGVVAALVVGAARQIRIGGAAVRTWALVGLVLVVVGLAALPFLSVQVRDTLADYVAPPHMIDEIFGPDPDSDVLYRLQPRVGLYLGSLAIARDHFPLGAGIGRFGSHMSREEYSPVYAEYGMDTMYGIAERAPIAVTDAFWPMILGETGVLGLVGAGLFFGLLGRDLWRAAAINDSTIMRVLLLGALLAFVEALVRSLTSSVFVAPPIAYWVFGTIGLALSAARAEVTSSAEGT